MLDEFAGSLRKKEKLVAPDNIEWMTTDNAGTWVHLELEWAQTQPKII